jgi:hypothetical protein
MRNKELRRDSEARTLSREERNMMVIIRQNEEMEQKETALKAAPRSTQLEGRVGMEMRKWVRNVAFATCAILGGARQCQHRGRTVRKVGWARGEPRSSGTRGTKRPCTIRGALKAKGKRRLWTVRSESVSCPKQTAKQGSSSVGRKWVGKGQEEAL